MIVQRLLLLLLLLMLLLGGRQSRLRTQCNPITVRRNRSSIRFAAAAAAAELSCGPDRCLLRRWRRFGWPLCHRLAGRRFRSNL